MARPNTVLDFFKIHKDLWIEAAQPFIGRLADEEAGAKDEIHRPPAGATGKSRAAGEGRELSTAERLDFFRLKIISDDPANDARPRPFRCRHPPLHRDPRHHP